MWSYDNDRLRLTVKDWVGVILSALLLVSILIPVFTAVAERGVEQEPTTTVVTVECEPYSVRGTVVESTVLGDVRVRDTTGNEWLLTNECTLQCGDTVVLTLTDNGTPTDNTDDRVLTVYNTDTHKAITVSKYNSQCSTPMEW